MSEQNSQGKPTGWVEHTVVANLPRRFPGTQLQHAPLADVSEPRTLIGMPLPAPAANAALGIPFVQTEEPRTVVGEAPSRAQAQQLIARYAALAAQAEPLPSPPETSPLPLHEPWFRRFATFARNDFQRAPRIVRLLLPALPLVAAATTFLDVDPRSPALSRAVAVAATSSPAAPPAASTTAPPPLPTSSVPIVRHSGRTLAADAADAAARGDRSQAVAIYLELAREHPTDVVYASAARILMRDEQRNRPHSGQ